MFSENVLISMANGGKKLIKDIKVNDLILNKFGRVTNVRSVKKYMDYECIYIQLDNNSDSFYVNGETIVLGYYRGEKDKFISEYCSISDILDKRGYIKSDLKIFSPDSDIEIMEYKKSEEMRTLYSLVTSDESKSYKVNNMIVSNRASRFKY
jgi:hypothetical protein